MAAPKAKAPKRSRGRPRQHDRDAVMGKVCVRVARGALVKHAATAEGTTADVIREWGLHPEYATLYARARESQAHALAEETLELADASARARSAEEVASYRLRVDTRKWYTSKIAPRTFGDRTTLVGDPDQPVEHRVTQRWKFGETTVEF